MLEYCINKARTMDSGGRVRVFSVVVDSKGNMLGEGLNNYNKTHTKQSYYANKANLASKTYLHSELLALTRALKTNKKIAKIYIARVGRNGEVRDAAPCPICSMLIEQEFPNIEVEYTKEK